MEAMKPYAMHELLQERGRVVLKVDSKAAGAWLFEID